jgi:hypothetical protein
MYLLTFLFIGEMKMHATVSKLLFTQLQRWLSLHIIKNNLPACLELYLLIEYTDFDLDEEFSSCNDLKVNKVPSKTHFFFTSCI